MLAAVPAEKAGPNVGKASGMENEPAVAASDVVIITVPYSGQADILAALRDAIGDKLVVDTVVPVQFAKGKITAIPVDEGSAAEQAKAVLPDATVVSAFQNLSAETLMDHNEQIDCSVVVCGGDKGFSPTCDGLSRGYRRDSCGERRRPCQLPLCRGLHHAYPEH